MDKLSKQQKDEYATVFALLALYDGGAEIKADSIRKLLEATGNTEVEAFYPIIFANFLKDPATLAKVIATPSGGGGGGGGGGGPAGGAEGDAAPAAEEEKVEEEEMDMGGAVDMFGAGNAGGGDY